MSLIVQKFGGTSVAGTDLIKKAAEIIIGALKRGDKVICVVSAMAGVTNGLVSLCDDLSSLNDDSKISEYDSALCSGEIVASALLSLALIERGYKARSFSAFQLPIICKALYGKAFVESVETGPIIACLDSGVIPVIAGFQGITEDNRFVTLGRGGSDTTAALVAGRIKVDFCDIYTDVDGVFTADPRIVPKARKLDNISLGEMLELSSSGAKVLHPRCVEVAMRYEIPIRVFSSFSLKKGTLISSETEKMENKLIKSIGSNKNIVKISIEGSKPDFMELLQILGRGGVNIEWVFNEFSGSGKIFIINLSDERKTKTLLKEAGATFFLDEDIAMVALVGYGLKNDTELPGDIISRLKKESIDISALQVSEIKIALLLKEADTEKAIKTLHETFITEEFNGKNKNI